MLQYTCTFPEHNDNEQQECRKVWKVAARNTLQTLRPSIREAPDCLPPAGSEPT
jgi:hypothetical protein